MSSNVVRVEATPKLGDGMRDVRGDSVKRQLAADHNIEIDSVRSIVGFLISSEITSEQVSERADDIFADPIIEESSTDFERKSIRRNVNWQELKLPDTCTMLTTNQGAKIFIIGTAHFSRFVLKNL